MGVSKGLTRTYENAVRMDLNENTKIIFFSDLHRGKGDWSDDFAHNKQIFFHALQHYFNDDFTYIEIGDGDERWENKNFEEIKIEYYDIFELMSRFYKKNRLCLIWGNHNRDWENSETVRKDTNGLFDDIKVNEGIRLGDEIFIVHGHQVDFLCNNRFGRVISKYIVRTLWQPFQNIFGFKDPTSPAKNFEKRDKVENKIFNWAKQEKKLVIAGHTHRPMFSSLSKKDRIQKEEEKQGEPYYFNVGSCVHPRCITGIEIEGGFIRLVKWFNNVDPDGRLFIDKKVLEQENLHKVLDRLSESG